MLGLKPFPEAFQWTSSYVLLVRTGHIIAFDIHCGLKIESILEDMNSIRTPLESRRSEEWIFIGHCNQVHKAEIEAQISGTAAQRQGDIKDLRNLRN